MSSRGGSGGVIEVDSDPAATDEEWGEEDRAKATGRRTTRPSKDKKTAAAASSSASTRAAGDDDSDDSDEDGEAWRGNDDDDESSYEDEDERKRKGRRTIPSPAKKRGRPHAPSTVKAPAAKAPPLSGKAVATKATQRGQPGASGSTLVVARTPVKKYASDLKPAAKAKAALTSTPKSALSAPKSAPPTPSRRKLPGGDGAGIFAAPDAPYGDMDVHLPARLPLECGILMQLSGNTDDDTNNVGSWELDGATGAVGRLEVDANGVILDLKGSQYRGTFFPCATAMILTVVTQRVTGEGDGSDVTIRRHVKLDGMTDEFCRLVPTGENALDQMSATVHGNLNDYDDDDDDYDEYEYGKHVTDVPHAGGGGRGDSAGATASSGLDFPPAAASSAAGTPKRKPAPASSAKRPAPSNGKGKATPKASKRKAS